ncbi:hypothetical protein DC094_17590 [Pelagibaculum spongiae]|uniref:Uncharacterized protein n=2 Tax=Pelagibaculum spongiae TaxID=2080658 RepID=A0A2V1GXL6_9GAMM|nr:hypothetical protein DC094_17590 [Pelagibaculum spongiae]
MKNIKIVFLSSFLFSAATIAGEVDVVDAKVTKNNDGSYDFSVSLLHADSGWDHYANRWELLDNQQNILATRTLHHPHENEQPFTRSLHRVKIPAGVKQILVRGHDLVHGYGGKQMTIELN